MASLQPADRTKEITPFLVMEIMEKIFKMEAQGIDVVHLEIGEPDFDTPACVKKEVNHAFECCETSYTHSLGDLRLREAICTYHDRTYGTSINPERIIVTSGTSPAMLLLFSALLNPKDEVIISDPHYICYPNFIRYCQGVPVPVPVFEKDAFQYTPEAIAEKITDRTKAILLNSPSNPTGNVMPKAVMEKIVDMANTRGIAVISDEIYHGLVYEDVAHSLLELTDEGFVFNGFSKLFAMTGLRLGYLIAPESFIRPLQILQQNFFICANSVIQLAGASALEHADEETETMRQTYNKRRRYMIDRLRSMGFGITQEPTGAFYVFANAKFLSHDSYALSMELLENAHVGITPGIAFGNNGEGYLRFSYANSLENIEIAMDRIEAYLTHRNQG